VIPDLSRSRPLFPALKGPDAEAFLAFEARVADALATEVARWTGLDRSEFRVAVTGGSAHGGILGEAARNGAGSIVIGGRATPLSGHARTAELVVRYADCPVLVVRPSPQDGPVLAATDLSEASLPAVAAAMEATRERATTLVVIHVVETLPAGTGILGIPAPVPSPNRVADWLEAARTQVQTAISALGATGQMCVVDGHPSQAILEAAQQLRAQLVVVGTRGRTGFERMAMGSVAETVVRESPCSVLVVRLRFP
jgi:nucleotide-binding universal stress UspA family protein